MKKVDIILPVYNAYEYTKKCIETVINNTDLTENNLIILNDKSTDVNILPMLKNIENLNKNLNIIIIDNEENVGFVKTVNKGLVYSNNDVVILNSDTEVTNKWLEKLKECAYSQPLVATVTPLSNNATLASVPNFMEENDLPKNINLEEYSKLIERISFNDFPQIPTGHGFCMYITRDSIDNIGIFDDITFGKGYGEENDFCYRCLEHGYVNLLCDNTFIYHKGTQSFSKEKDQLINSHIGIIKNKYPICFENTNEYCIEKTNTYIQKNIKYEINSINRKNILIIIHDFKSMEDKNIGGTTLHVYDIINGLRKHFNFHVLYYYNNQYYVKSFFEETEEILEFNNVTNYGLINLYNNEYEKLIENIIKVLKINLIHIHHLKEHYLNVFNIAKENNISTIITMHDFYANCPTIQMLNENNKYCDNLKEKDCTKCLKSKFNLNSNIINIWHKCWLTSLKLADKIITPSDNTKNKILELYNGLDIEVIEHGVENKKDLKEIIVNENDSEKFNIAFIGGIGEHKGINILKQLTKKCKHSDINIHLFGITSDERFNKSATNYIYHGMYNRNEISKLLIENNIKLVCLFSILPETYSYTLTESYISNIPVISFDIGAIAERVNKIDGGYIIDLNSSTHDIFNEILRIKDNKNEYDMKISNISKINFKTLNQMNDEYLTLYKSIIKDNKENKISNLKRKEFFSTNINKDNQIKTLNKRLESIYCSRTYKFSRKMSKFFNKFKKQKNNITI